MENLEIVTVNSKAINLIIWDHQNNRMMIKFKDSPLYAYPQVSKSTFKEFVEAPSKGRFFQQHIQNQEYIRLDN